MTLRGLFKNSAKIQCCVGIKLRQLNGGFFYNLKVEGFSWHGIWMVYKKPVRGETLDSVKRVRISNCQILDNKGAGIAMDPPAFDNVIDNCTISGNSGGSTDDKKMTAGIQLSSDADGGIGKNKILNNRVTNNYRGIMVIATNGYKTTDNAICNNTSTGNIQEGISDNNSEDNHYIANSINGNRADLDGKVYTGPLTYYDQWLTKVQTASGNSSVKLVENSNPGAASIECRIPDILRALPQFTTPAGTTLPIYYSYAGETST